MNKREKAIDNRRSTAKAEAQAEKERQMLKKGMSDVDVILQRDRKDLDKILDNDTARGIVFPELAKAKVNKFVDDTEYPECHLCYAQMAKFVGYEKTDIFKQRPQYAFVCQTCGFSVTTDEKWSAPYKFGFKIPKHIRKKVDDILLN